MTDWENLAKKLEAVTVLETYENGSQLVQNAHPDGFLAAAVIREQAARIAVLEAALKPFDELLQRDFSIIANDERYADGFSATALLRLGDLRAARAALEKKND